MVEEAVVRKAREAVRAEGIDQKYLTNVFKEVDVDQDGYIAYDDEWPKVVQALGIKLKYVETRKLGISVGVDEEKRISLSNFLAFFAPEIPMVRLNAIEAAFKKISQNGKDVVISEFVSRYGGADFVTIGGRKVKTPQLISDLGKNFDEDHDGKITGNDFLVYYKGLSKSIVDDDEFVKMIEASWDF
jgi:Ca2+-binding EF-hand superfamily protein